MREPVGGLSFTPKLDSDAVELIDCLPIVVEVSLTCFEPLENWDQLHARCGPISISPIRRDDAPLFSVFEFVPGINWVYLQAGVRLRCMLRFGEAGALDLLIVS